MSRDAFGASIRSGAPTAGLVAVTPLPGGGVLSVDLLRPAVPYDLVLNADQLEDPTLAGYAAEFGNAVAAGDALPQLPTPWLRMALCAGVDRWSLSELDEELVCADRALAAADAGLSDVAGALFEAAAARLRSLVEEQLDLGEARLPALAAQLRLVLNGAARSVPALFDLRALSRRLSSDRGSTAGVVLEQQAGRSGHVRIENPTVRTLPRVVLDPLRVPARLLAGFAFADQVHGHTWQIHCPASPTITQDHPAVHRLLVRIVDDATGALVSVGPLGFDPVRGEFTATVRVSSRDGMIVDVMDVLARGDTRWTSTDLVEIGRLRDAQEAFSLAREAIAARRLGAEAGSRVAFGLALTSLGGASAGTVDFARHIADALDAPAGAPVDLAVAGTGPLQPLLCELVHAAGRGTSAPG